MTAKGEETDEDVVGFDISMHDLAFPQKRQSEEHLRSVRSDSLEIDTDVLSESLDDFSKVHTATNEENQRG